MAEDMANDESLTPKEGSRVEQWLSLIDEATKDASKYLKKVKAIRRKYKYEESLSAKRRKFQLLWSNQEILKPAVYAKCPSPSVSNRWKDGDAVARIASELIERNIDFQFDTMDYDYAFKQMRNSYLLFARGVVRLRYSPIFDSAEVDPDNDGFGAGAGPKHAGPEADTAGEPYSRGVEGDGAARGADDNQGEGAPGDGQGDADNNRDTDGRGEGEGEGEGEEVLQMETIALDFVHITDFIHPKVRDWKELPWLGFISYMDRDALKTRFKRKDKAGNGKTVGELCQLDTVDDGEDRQKKASTGINPRKATVYEIWDKTKRKVLWLSPGYPEVMDECRPYLKLEGFWPCPRPAYGTLPDDDLEPIPDYVFYQDQAEEIDNLTARIGALTDSLKLVGFFPAGPGGEGAPEIIDAVKPGFENKMVPVKSWAAFAGNAGGKAVAPIVWLPIEQVVETLKGCVEMRKQQIDDVYQLTGISDIIRGTTEAEETAAAQGLKSQWGSLRLKDKQNELARVGKDVTRMVAEIMANHFQMSTLMKVANLKIPTEAEQEAEIEQYRVALRQFVIEQQQKAAMNAQGGLSPVPAPGGAMPAPGVAGRPQGAPQPAPSPMQGAHP